MSEEGMLDIHLVFIGASCVHAKIDDSEVFIFDVWIWDFLDGVGVFVDSFIHLLSISDDLFQLSHSSKFFLLLLSFDRVSGSLLVLLVGLFLHECFC